MDEFTSTLETKEGDTESTPSLRIDVPCPLCGANSYRVLYEPEISINDPAILLWCCLGHSGDATDCPMRLLPNDLRESTIFRRYDSFWV